MQNRIDNIVKWIRNQVPEGGKAVLGISGGKDSTIAAALCVKALGKENVIGVLMPNGVQNDISDSYVVCKHLGIFSLEVNIEDAYEGIRNSVGEALSNRHIAFPYEKVYTNGMIKTNLPARLRMATLYAVAALYPNSRVVNTCNFSEDYVGYSTKYGDAAGDFSPLGYMTVREVLAIGDALGLPYDLVHKTPSDGMCGKTDEDNLGFTYEELDTLLRDFKRPSPEKYERIMQLHNNTRHKYKPMPTFGLDREE
jgi:NAD+ synthase